MSGVATRRGLSLAAAPVSSKLSLAVAAIGRWTTQARSQQAPQCRAPVRLLVQCSSAKGGGTKGFGKLALSSASPSGAVTSSVSTTPAVLTADPPAATMAAVLDVRVDKLRQAMAAADGGRGVAAYVVPTDDPHMSEYPAGCYARREYISKFTGTAGTVVVTADSALLWTDGRYFLQAASELGPGWTLMKAGTPECPDLEDWLANTLPEGARVGIDPWVHTVNGCRTLQRKLEAAGKVLVPLLDGGNLVDVAWGKERLAPPTAPLRVHDLRWAGEDVPSKLKRMREQMRSAKADVLLVTALDEVAWMTNTRGGDVEHNPVTLSYMLITESTATLYVDPSKVAAGGKAVEEHLAAAGVEVKAYGSVLGDVAAAARSGQSLWLDPARTSYAVYQAAKEAAKGSAASSAAGKKRAREDDEGGAATAEPAANAANGTGGKLRVVELPSPVVAAKAIKNAAELAGMREAHLRDAEAVCEFLYNLEQQVGSGGTLTEVEVDLQLTGRRAAQPGWVETSFSTIAGAGPNGAVIHYRAQPETCRTVDGNTLLLLDSGGQYDCGTTDITRTMHMGRPTDHQRRCFTCVLQGHIALDTAVFPEGTPGAALDTLARLALWREGLNYRHGTGHGVGAALNVHEGPQSISSRLHITVPLAAGMVCSNEPGYYEDGAFGVRIENLVVVVEKQTPFRYAGVPYFGFSRLTLVPLQAKMVDVSLLSPSEVAWVDEYHQEVWDHVAPRLQGQPAVLEWLRTNTRPLAEQAATATGGQ